MANFTPGPWEVTQREDLTLDIRAVNDNCFPAQILGDPTDTECGPEIRANAALIAAAPELLDALQKIVAFNGCTGGPEKLIAEFKHIARTAIAKAEENP